MTTLRPLAACAAALWLAACAVPRPPETVQPPAPPQWYAPLPHGGTLADLTQWWQQFDDPLLVELVAAAQTVSPTVATAASRIEQARAARVAAGAALLPVVDANASLARGRQPPSPLATTVQGGAQAAWEIDLFGGNHLATRAAELRFEGAQAGWHEARVAVAAETATSYVDLRTCERLVLVAGNDARSRAETARLTALSAQAGFTAPAVAALARASAAEGAARAAQQQAQCELALKGLVALTGIAEPRLRKQLTDRWVEPERFALPDPPSIPARLLAQRPDLYRAGREVAAASAEVGSARADQLPQLSLAGSIAVGRARVGGATVDLESWSLGPLALTVPVFDGGRRAAAADAALARYEEAVALYTAGVRQAVGEVERALVSLESARARGEDARTAVEGYRASFAATEARYRNGLASLIELEDQRRAVLAAETALLALQRERVAAWIALYRAVGGGWREPREPQQASPS